MSAGEAKVENIEEVNKALMALADKVNGTQLATALKAAGLIIEGDAVKMAPIDTGTLRRSIMTEAAATGDHTAEARVGTNLEYGPFMEFGTIHIAPRPYLRPAFDKNKTAVMTTVAEILKGFVAP